MRLGTMSQGQAVEVRTREAIGEGVASATMESPEYWECQDNGMYAKDRSPHEPKTSCVLERWGWLSKSFGFQKMMSESQVPDIELYTEHGFTVLNFDFALT